MGIARGICAGVVVALTATGVAAAGTDVRTIGDRDGDGRLEYGPGEAHVRRADLGGASAPGRRTALLTFAQLSDLHVIDEESPARVEFLDRTGGPFTSAYRPQEGLTPHVVDSMVRAARRAVSPVTGRRGRLAMSTGDNTDNTQLNETRWMIDLLDGGRIEPDSGVPGSCGTDDGERYQGVRGGGQYYEPDGAGDGPGYERLRDFPGNLATGQGNYAFHPRPGLRFVVLDTISENGGDGGNLDHTQFRWVGAQLAAAEQAGELAVLFGHHTIATMDQTPVSPFPPGDLDGDHSPVVHFGEDGRPCGPPDVTETFACLLLRHPSAIAYVAGHEHRNRIRAFPRAGGGGFWEVGTASHVDWPQQSRLLDLVDNRDGTLSLFSTVLDHAAPPRGRRPASIARELAFNNPHASAAARGTRADRNAELLVPDPR